MTAALTVCEHVTELINTNLGLARKIAHDDFRQPGYDPEETYQEALIGLWNAARYWKEEKGSFRIYAAVCIRNRLKRHFGKRDARPLPQFYEDGLIDTVPERREIKASSLPALLA